MKVRDLLCGLLLISLTSSHCCADGDQFYHSTWYGQPSQVLSWSSQSVMRSDAGAYPFFAIGSISPASPRNFVPGYGYSLERGFATTRWSAYEPAWSYGMLQPRNTSPREFGGGTDRLPLIVPGTLHSPWFLPGSPANSRAPLQY